MTVYVFPGQGSQYKGMGERLFDIFPEITSKSNEILGYSIKELCLDDSAQILNFTQYTQPALYIVNALHYFLKIQEDHQAPAFLVGHSLGEYNALLAAGVYDFETGLTLVKKRGELMSNITDGAMAAVIGWNANELILTLKQFNLSNITIANYNSPKQHILSGNRNDIECLEPIIESKGTYKILNVSGPFHSSYMKTIERPFKEFLAKFHFLPPKIPVISNVTGKPYLANEIHSNLSQQLSSPVQWQKSIEYILNTKDYNFIEIGPGKVLTGLINNIKSSQMINEKITDSNNI